MRRLEYRRYGTCRCAEAAGGSTIGGRESWTRSKGGSNAASVLTQTVTADVGTCGNAGKHARIGRGSDYGRDGDAGSCRYPSVGRSGSLNRIGRADRVADVLGRAGERPMSA